MINRYTSKAIYVKIRAKLSHRLHDSDYHELLARDNVDSIAAFLRTRSHYAKQLSMLAEKQIAKRDLEKALRKAVFLDYLECLRYDRRAASFYRFPLVKLEIEQIMTCLRYLAIGQSERLIFDLPGYLIPHLHLDLLKLARVRSFEELLTALSHTPYCVVLSPYRPDDENSWDEIACECALDRYYADYLLRLSRESLSASETSIIKDFVCEQVELQNLNLILRMKSFPQIKIDRVRSYLNPLTGRLKSKELQALIEAANPEEFKQVLALTALGRILGRFGNTNLLGSTFLELQTTKLLYSNCLRLLAQAQDGSLAFLAFHYLDQIELRNLVTLIEGAAYGLPPDEIAQLLIYQQYKPGVTNYVNS